MSGVNDFAVKIATVNGSGSASANRLLAQMIFRMGVPVSGKNLLPSNIQGLPTWYEIRANGCGYTGRTLDYDLVVALNAHTAAGDIAETLPGGYVLYDSTWPRDPGPRRGDVTFLPMPLSALCAEHFGDGRDRVLLRNIAYIGALAALLAVDTEIATGVVAEAFAGKETLLLANQRAFGLGYDYAVEHFACPLPFHVTTTDATTDTILIDGNTAAALGGLYAGATVAAWYPITPATAVMQNFSRLCRRYRRSAEGRNNYLILQAEDELAAIGMVVGAGWAGARAFTSTSGPGLSLMNEMLGLAYFTEIPTVLVDVQRAGPSTGMPTRTQQADILLAAYASHGDTKHILLFPANPAECFEMVVRAFDLAEHFQTPVLVLSDLDLGMNDWVVPRLTWDDAYTPDRGRVLSQEELAAIPGFFRYDNADDESVTPRTLPGVDPKAAYFTRGSGHNRFGNYTEAPEEYEQVVDRLARKHAAAAAHTPAPISEQHPGARLGVVTVGSCDQPVREAVDLLARAGTPADYLRVRGFPFHKEIAQFLDRYDTCFVVEQNRDAQLRSLLVLEAGIPGHKLRSVLSYGGLPLTARQVVEGVTSQLGA